ncbi:M23 family metallopeptidase [Gallaecimonas sp. GXIMD4217]|uniref:M23 family metallopeptidase n=1 Tax=Gallaecimonas sp. GXIMD4217 TaxID=3131927 RepID=UPI00311AEBDB
MKVTFIIERAGRSRQWSLPAWLLAALLLSLLMLLLSLPGGAGAKAQTAMPGEGVALPDASRWQWMSARLGEAEARLVALRTRAELLSRRMGLGPLPEQELSDANGLALLENRYQTLEKLLGRHQIASQSEPTASPLPEGRQASAFGYRQDPFNGRRRFHAGLDLAADQGTPVLASASGVVTYAGRYKGYGLLVELEHGDGVTTRYGHNSGLEVKAGERVEKGQIIARVGSSGRATGPHVHFEVRHQGKPQDPKHFVYPKGVD